MGVAVEVPYKRSRAGTRNRWLDRSYAYRSCFCSVFKPIPFQKNSKTGTVNVTFFVHVHVYLIVHIYMYLYIYSSNVWFCIKPYIHVRRFSLSVSIQSVF